MLKKQPHLAILKDLKDASPESVRMTVFHYVLSAAWNGDLTALQILGEFEKRADDGNKMGDILLRCERLAFKWKRG